MKSGAQRTRGCHMRAHLVLTRYTLYTLYYTVHSHSLLHSTLLTTQYTPYCTVHSLLQHSTLFTTQYTLYYRVYSLLHNTLFTPRTPTRHTLKFPFVDASQSASAAQCRFPPGPLALPRPRAPPAGHTRQARIEMKRSRLWATLAT